MVLGDSIDLSADEVVVATGAHSAPLVASLAKY